MLLGMPLRCIRSWQPRQTPYRLQSCASMPLPCCRSKATIDAPDNGCAAAPLILQSRCCRFVGQDWTSGHNCATMMFYCINVMTLRCRSSSSEPTPGDSRLAIILEPQSHLGSAEELVPYARESALARTAGALPGACDRPELQTSQQIGAHRRPPPARLASALQAGSKRHKCVQPALSYRVALDLVALCLAGARSPCCSVLLELSPKDVSAGQHGSTPIETGGTVRLCFLWGWGRAGWPLCCRLLGGWLGTKHEASSALMSPLFSPTV